MIYLQLFWEFLKIGLFTFGGGYAAIPLIQDSVLGKGWMTEEMLSNILAVSESTPGPIMVNTATYVGSTQAGIAGAACATLGVILPSFVVILLVASLLKRVIDSKPVRGALSGMKPGIVGMILATGVFMAYGLIVSGGAFDFIAFVIFLVLILLSVMYQVLKKKEFPPILLIIISAVLGILLY